jgi:integrase
VSVYKPRGSGLYVYDFQLGGRRFLGSTGKAERRAAEGVEAQARLEARATLEREKAQAAQLQGKAPLTLDVAAGRWWTEVGRHHVASATTWSDLERLVARFGPATRLDAITDSHVAAWVAARRGDTAKGRKTLKDGSPAPMLSNARVNRSTVDLLRKLFTRARKAWKVPLPAEPDWTVHRLPETTRVREMRGSEEEALHRHLPEGYRDVWRFAVASGLRLDECLLRWSEIDAAAGIVTVTQKGSRPHTIPLSREMAAIVFRHEGGHPEWVFTYVCRKARRGRGPDDPRARVMGQRYPVTYEGLKTAWKAARKAAGLPDLRFHDMRHTAATRLLRRTGNLKLAQQLLGHEDITTTATYYAHASIEDLRAALDSASPKPGKRKTR